MNNLHVVLNNFKNDSRVLKETQSIGQMGFFSTVFIAALFEQGCKEHEVLSYGREVWRVPLKSGNWLRHMPHQIVTLINYLEWMWRIVKTYRKRDVAVVHCHDLQALPVGVAMRLLYSVRIVYDAHEFETEQEESARCLTYRWLRYWFARALEHVLIGFADAIICVSESIAQAYRSRYRIKKPHLVLNCPFYQETVKKNHFRELFKIPEKTVIFLYQGGLKAERGIEAIIQAFEQRADDRAVCVFMGMGPLAGLVRAHAKISSRIYYLDAVSPEILLNYTASADIGFSVFQNTCLNLDYCLPNKFFEYLMADLPVLVSNLTELRAAVLAHKVGFIAPDASPASISAAIDQFLLVDKQELIGNIQVAKKIFNWERQEITLRKVYMSLMPSI